MPSGLRKLSEPYQDRVVLTLSDGRSFREIHEENSAKLLSGEEDVFTVNGKVTSLKLIPYHDLVQVLEELKGRLKEVDSNLCEKAAELSEDAVRSTALCPVIARIYAQQQQLEAQMQRVEAVMKQSLGDEQVRRGLRA